MRGVWWKLDSIVDVRTIVLKSEKGEIRTFTLAGIGMATNPAAATNFINKTIGGRKLIYWPVQSEEKNWDSRPMCIFYGYESDVELKKPIISPPSTHPKDNPGVVYDSPMLNEDMLYEGVAAFTNNATTGDEYYLQRRLRLADELRRKVRNK